MYNPKGTVLSGIKAADINKKAIAKLAKKATDDASALPFFIKSDFEFADKQIAPLFIFGKIKAFKNEIKNLKGATEQHGFAFVQTDEKGKHTLCLVPTRGKLAAKSTELKKASKAVFGAAIEVQIFAPIAEADIAAREAAAEAKADALPADEVESIENEAIEGLVSGEVSERSRTAESPAKPVANVLEQMAALAKQQLLAFSKNKTADLKTELVATLSKFLEASKTQADKITAPISDFLGKAQTAYATLTAQSEAAPLAPKAQRKAILSNLKKLAAQINALSAKTN